jgi:flagellum-specific peptidoglycan hydrolase FlgJ
MNKVKLTLCCLLLLSINICSAQEVTLRYIRKHTPMAMDLSQQWGIPTSIILGVSTLESGSGTSLNCRQLNNYFGVKGRNHLKKRHTKYKQYASAEESFADFCGILSRKRFYPALKNNMDYHLWLKDMNKSKYSSAQEVWVHRIKMIISEYELYKLDVKQPEPDNSQPNNSQPAGNGPPMPNKS